MRAHLEQFLANEDSAVAADWLGLIGAVVAVGLLATYIVGQSAVDASAELESALHEADLGSVIVAAPSSGAASASSGAPKDPSEP